ncbi:hypothetical protein MUK42_30815 [Musa troglodytarum]|uniref:Uncharacterized protein n=1 Tax=Musa troglodytarum TaxID=320322 RepID=A0A9E7GM21_9LILI|nr:hypothetical protein MUK42_30815 [Musa troglodytarum]
MLLIFMASPKHHLKSSQEQPCLLLEPAMLYIHELRKRCKEMERKKTDGGVATEEKSSKGRVHPSNTPSPPVCREERGEESREREEEEEEEEETLAGGCNSDPKEKAAATNRKDEAAEEVDDDAAEEGEEEQR